MGISLLQSQQTPDHPVRVNVLPSVCSVSPPPGLGPAERTVSSAVSR